MRRAAHNASAPIGKLIRKIMRQPLPNRLASMINPPRIWPKIAANPSVMPSQAKARRRCCGTYNTRIKA